MASNDTGAGVGIFDHMEQVWMVTCSRCKEEGLSWRGDMAEAEYDLRHQGWKLIGVRLFCPRCNHV